MRPERRAEQIVGVVGASHPVAHRLVDGVLQRFRSGIDASNLGAEQSHAEDVQRLARHVFGAHVDDALEAEQRAGGGAGHAVLSRAGLGHDALLAHAHREQRLPEGVVDLVRAGVRQIFTLEEDARAAAALAQPPRVPERRRPSDVLREQPRQLGDKTLLLSRAQVLLFERLNGGHERLRDEAPAVGAVVAADIGIALAERRT